jgi:hypothetical protein
MGQGVFKSSFLALALVGIASSAAAHHPPRFERCQYLSFPGQIEQIEWGNPHVELVIKSEDGVSHRAAWLNLQILGRAGIIKETLHVGDQVVVSGGVRTDDVSERPMVLNGIRRTSDGWEWSQPPQGC